MIVERPMSASWPMISHAANAVSATKKSPLTVTRRSSAIGVSATLERRRDLWRGSR